jgi:hypothetical protein
MIAGAIYVLCALTSAICAALLVRRYRQVRLRLLLWSSLCFVGLALNNLLLVVDLLVLPTDGLALWRSGTALAAMLLLLVGLVWESDR